MLQRSASWGDCEEQDHVVTVGDAVTQSIRMLALRLGGPVGRWAGVPEGRWAGRVFSLQHSVTSATVTQNVSTVNDIWSCWLTHQQTGHSPSLEADNFSAIQNSRHFVESAGSLSRSQQRANCPYRELDEFTPHLLSCFCRSMLLSSFHLGLDLVIGLFPPGSPTETP